MRKIARLVGVKDQNLGGHGLIIQGSSFELCAATAPSLLVHDLIEHQNGAAAIGTVWDELEAIGAAWATRGQWGDSGGYQTPHEVLQNDLQSIWGDWHGLDFPALPRINFVGENDDITCIVQGFTPYGFEPEQIQLLENFKSLAESYMQRGFHRCMKRFAAGGRFGPNNLWHALETALETPMHDLYIGQRFTLQYGFDPQGNAYANVIEIY